jgi:putative transposase
VKQRGLQIAPEIAVGDGALGFWKALDEVFPGTRHQLQVRSGGRMSGQGSRRTAGLLRLSCRALGSPAHHHSHRERVRHVRHRTVRTKGSLSPTTAKLMVFKLVIAASKTWRRLKGTNQLPKLIAGVRFNDGIEVIHMPANHAA